MSNARRRDQADGHRGTGNDPFRMRWTCPYCGHGQRELPVTESTKREAVVALRTHITSTPGGGHGPPNALPDDDSLAIAHHVIVSDAG